MENKPKSPVGFTFSDAEVATVDKLLGTLADLSVRVPFTKRTDYPQALKQLAAAAFPSAGPELDRLVSLLEHAVAAGAEALGNIGTRCGSDCMITCSQPEQGGASGCSPGGCYIQCANNCNQETKYF